MAVPPNTPASSCTAHPGSQSNFDDLEADQQRQLCDGGSGLPAAVDDPDAAVGKTTALPNGAPDRTLADLVAAEAEIGVLAADLAAAEELRRGRLSDASRRLYADCWARLRTWAWEHGLGTEPLAPEALAAFLGHLHRRGCKPGTLQIYVAAVAHVHRQESRPDPTRDPRIRHLLEGARRADAGGRRRRRRAPLLACPADGGDGEGDLQRVLVLIPPTVAGIRDRALLLIGWGGALRVSELVALDAADIEVAGSHLIVRLGRSKTDQTGEGALVTIAAAKDPRFCPVTAWQAWLRLSGITDGPAFRRLRAGRNHRAVGITDDRLSDQSVRLAIKRWAGVAGIDPDRLSSHSMRRGFLTTAALKGVDPWRMQQHARHASLRTTEQYVEMARARKGGAGEGLL